MNELVMLHRTGGRTTLCRILTLLHVGYVFNFDITACFGSGNNIGDVLVKVRNIIT